MNIFMPVKKDEEILDGVFDFNGRLVYTSLAYAFAHDKVIHVMEGQLLDEEQIKECVCQSLMGGRYSKLKVKWVTTYSKIVHTNL